MMSIKAVHYEKKANGEDTFDQDWKSHESKSRLYVVLLVRKYLCAGYTDG
jgi:hypothetical protein